MAPAHGALRGYTRLSKCAPASLLAARSQTRLLGLEGLASYCKAETTFTFHLSILTLSNASLGINNREIKSESGISFAIASQPFAVDCILNIAIFVDSVF